MRYSKQLLATVLLMLFAIPAIAHQSYYSNYNRGLSFNIGYASDGVRLSYSNSHYPKKYYSNHYGYSSNYKSYKYKKASPYLGYKKRAIPHHKTYSKKHPTLGLQYKKHSVHEPFYNYKDRHYDGRHSYKDRRYNNHHSYKTKACHPVTKLITDAHGYYHSVRGTMCYNKYGQGYIVERH